MQQFMEWFRDFWAQWGPWITVSLIPTVITGLSLSPKTVGVAGTVQRILDFMKQVLSFFSIATFKNQKGTWQLPIIGGLKVHRELKASRRMGLKPDFVVDESPPTPPGAGSSSSMLSVLIIIALTNQGCCSWTGTCTDNTGKIVTGVVDCAKEGFKSEIANLIPTVLAILTGGAVNWNEQLDSLRTVGGDALGCAIASVGADLADLIKPGSTASEQEQQKATADLAKARSYLNSRGIQPTNVGN